MYLRWYTLGLMAYPGAETQAVIRNGRMEDVGQMLGLLRGYRRAERMDRFEYGSVETAFRKRHGAQELSRLITGLETTGLDESDEFFCQVVEQPDGELMSFACAEAPQMPCTEPAPARLQRPSYEFIFTLYQGKVTRRGFEQADAAQELEANRRRWAVGVGRPIMSLIDAAAQEQQLDMLPRGFQRIGALDRMKDYSGVLHSMQIRRDDLKLGIEATLAA